MNVYMQFSDSMRNEENLSWDFSILSGIVLALITFYIIQIVRLHFMPQETRNKITMKIWWSILLNLIALQIQNIVITTLEYQQTSGSVSSLTSYAINSTACFFFTNAIMLQIFEWDMLFTMIKF